MVDVTARDEPMTWPAERERRKAAEAEVERLRAALNKPLRETILAVLRTMPPEAAPEHLAAQIESQVRAWQRAQGGRS